MATGTGSFSIGDLAREFDVTTRTIRFYEDRGLLAPERHGQQRIYRPRDRVRLMLILRGRRLGFSLREVREMLDMYDAPDGEVDQLRYFIARIDRRRAELRTQRQDIEQVLAELDEVQRRCRDVLAQAKRGARGAPA